MNDSELLRMKRCLRCGTWWSLRPYACAYCGSAELEWDQASGFGTVRAQTTITRAPDEFWRMRVPYTLVLVKLVEGPTVMGHAEGGTEIGQTVCGQAVAIGDRKVLGFVRTESISHAIPST